VSVPVNSGSSTNRPAAPSYPEVTVIMPHFDCTRFLPEAVGSILEQDLGQGPGAGTADSSLAADPQRPTGLRLIVVDDCTPHPHWLRALEPFAADPRLIVLRTTQNVGHLRIKNSVLEHVSSPYIAFQDCDDVSLPGRLAAELTVLRAGEGDIVGCGLEYITETGRTLRIRKMPRNANRWMRLGRSFAILHPATTVRREVLTSLHGFDGTARVAADSDFHLRAAYRWRLRNVPEVLYRYRQRTDSLTGSGETGFGSAFREAYARDLAARERERRQARHTPHLSDLLRAPGNDVEFDLRVVDRAGHRAMWPPVEG
jgi:glycosyltransferase involved in cell wall biosynthesis